MSARPLARKSLATGVAAALLALPLSGCSLGLGGGSAPEAVATVPALSGKSTSIKLDKGFAAALTKLKLKPGTIGKARLAKGSLVFPITGGNVTVFEPGEVSPYVIGQIQHVGSGLSLSAGGTKVGLRNLNVDPGSSRVYGDVLVNGKVAAQSAYLFQLDGRTLEPLTTKGSTATLTGTEVKISPDAGGAAEPDLQDQGCEARPAGRDRDDRRSGEVAPSAPLLGENGGVSTQGESYEQWRVRTAPTRPARSADARTWDLAIAGLLAVFFLWLGGPAGWIGLALVALLLLEQAVRPRLARSQGTGGVLGLRGLVLVTTLGLSAWLVLVAGPVATPLPLLLLLLDVKDERSSLRSVRDRLAGRSGSTGLLRRSAQSSAGSTVAETSPSAIRPPSSPGALARRVTVSPSSRKVRPAAPKGSRPFQLSSRNEPSWSGRSPLMVPLANRSPCAARRR